MTTRTPRTFLLPGRALGALAAAALVCSAGCHQGLSSRERVRQQARERVQTAEELRSEGRLDEALAQFAQAIAENPTLTVAHLGMGDIYQEKGDYTSAEVSFRRAAEIEPGSFRAQFGHGLALQMLNRLAEAVRAYLRALTINPSDFEANRNLATAYLQLNEPLQALPYARRAVQLQPREGAARVNLGAVYAALDRHNEAVLEYQAAAEFMDLTPPLLLNLADSLGKANRWQEMLNTLDALIKLEPSAAAWERTGFALFKARQYEEAKDAFRRALEIDPDYYPALNGLGVSLMNEYLLGGRSDVAVREEALRNLRRSVQLNRDQPKIIELVTRYG